VTRASSRGLGGRCGPRCGWRRGCTRIGVARGLEVFATLAVKEKQPERAVQLSAAAAALRESAGVPLLPADRAEKYLAPARHIGESAVARLWAQGLALRSEAAVALAMRMTRGIRHEPWSFKVDEASDAGAACVKVLGLGLGR
jgi:hypothetical protein